jgi:hypothetical protein
MIDLKASILECGDESTPARLPRRGPRQSPLWSAVTGHRIVEATQAAADSTGRDRTKR